MTLEWVAEFLKREDAQLRVRCFRGEWSARLGKIGAVESLVEGRGRTLAAAFENAASHWRRLKELS